MISLDIDPNVATDNKEQGQNIQLPIYEKAASFKKQHLISGDSFSSEEELLAFIRKKYGNEGINRYNLAKFVLTKKKFVPAYDVLLAVASTAKSKVILATAGSGKTTMLQVDIVVSKMLDTLKKRGYYAPIQIEDTDIQMSRILFLNYNKHNVEPAKMKHRNFVKDINQHLVASERISDDIESSTAHAFCRKWLEIYREKLGLSEVKLIDMEIKNQILSAVIKPRWEKFYNTPVPRTIFSDIEALYNYKEEAMLDWETFFNSAKFIDSELSADFVKSCVDKYEALKKALKVFDFIDFIKEFINLMKSDEEVRQAVTSRYRLVIADEAQDFTALMNEILNVLQTDENKIIAVGDPDQTIYSFRGVSPDNILSLCRNLKGCEALTLNMNYRCPDKIVTAAKAILHMNMLRFDKEINHIKPGGSISMKSYSSDMEKHRIVINLLSKMTDEELEETVIAFRNNESSFILAEELFYAGIPYSLHDANKPFTNEIFSRIYSLLDALYIADDTDLNMRLWQVLPISKSLWHDIVQYNKTARISNIHDFIFDTFTLPESFYTVFASLLEIGKQMETIPCSQYINKFFDYFRLYYYNFLYKVLPDATNAMKKKQTMAEVYMDRTAKFFNRDITFPAAKREFIRSQRNSVNAVSLSTIHALKGLEYNTVIAIDMNDSIFPNFSRIEELYPLNTAMEEKEAENRLCYVLLTRAKERLLLLYDERDPSVYIQKIENKTDDILSLDDVVVTPRAGVDVPTDLSSKMKFITRLMNR